MTAQHTSGSASSSFFSRFTSSSAAAVLPLAGCEWRFSFFSFRLDLTSIRLCRAKRAQTYSFSLSVLKQPTVIIAFSEQTSDDDTSFLNNCYRVRPIPLFGTQSGCSIVCLKSHYLL